MYSPFHLVEHAERDCPAIQSGVTGFEPAVSAYHMQCVYRKHFTPWPERRQLSILYTSIKYCQTSTTEMYVRSSLGKVPTKIISQHVPKLYRIETIVLGCCPLVNISKRALAIEQILLELKHAFVRRLVAARIWQIKRQDSFPDNLYQAFEIRNIFVAEDYVE